MPAERRVEQDESNAQWAHRPKGTTAKKERGYRIQENA